jgi:hypothetical protein
MMGKEWDLQYNSPITGKLIRQEGYDAMVRFIQALESVNSQVKPTA